MFEDQLSEARVRRSAASAGVDLVLGDRVVHGELLLSVFGVEVGVGHGRLLMLVSERALTRPPS